MSKGFLATIDGGVKKLEEERERLQKERIGMHFCDCEFCDRNGSEVELKKVTERIQEIDKEVARLEQYKKDHVNA